MKTTTGIGISLHKKKGKKLKIKLTPVYNKEELKQILGRTNEKHNYPS